MYAINLVLYYRTQKRRETYVCLKIMKIHCEVDCSVEEQLHNFKGNYGRKKVNGEEFDSIGLVIRCYFSITLIEFL